MTYLFGKIRSRDCFLAIFILILGFGILVTVASCLTKKGKNVVKVNKTVFSIPYEKIKKVVLENGMTILAYQDASTPKVLIQIAYDIGSAVEQSHERGLAHLIEHMIFKGTDKLAEGDIDAIACKFGASFNAFTSNDVTSYYFQTNKLNWRNFADILFDCMKNARFDEQHLASELKAVVQELNMYKDQHIRAMFEKAISLAFPPNHPYHFPIIGYKEELARLKAYDLKHFYKKYYHPERATLFLVGDIDLDEDVKFVCDVFSKLEKTESAFRAHFPELIKEPEVLSTTIYHEIQRPWGCMYWTIPGHRQKGFEVANVLCPILGDGQGSRLHEALVDRLKIADDVSSHAEVMAEAGLMAIFFAPKDGKLEECYKAISQELKKIIENGVDGFELQRSVAGEVMTFFSHLEDPSQLIHQWMDTFFVSRDEFELFKYTSAIENLSTEDIANYVKVNLDPFLAGKIQMLPIPENAKNLWKEANAKTREQEALLLSAHQRTTPVEEPSFVYQLAEPVKLDFDFPQPTEIFTLKSGLKVITRTDKKLPIVCAQFAFKDSEFLGTSKEGLVVDLMTDLLIEGSHGFSKKENVDCLDSLGMLYNFSCSSNQFSITSANFAQGMEHFFRILTQPNFAKGSLEKLKDNYKNSFQRQKDSPKSMASRALYMDLYKGTDFAWSFDEAIEQNKAITLDLIKQKHAEFINPEAMTLTVVGDIDSAQLRNELEKLTADWKPSQKWLARTVPNPKTTSELDLKIPMFRDQSVLLIGRGSEVDVYHKDAIPLRLLNMITFESLGSRIYQLREQTGLFYTASGSFAYGMGRGKGVDLISTILNPENTSKTYDLIDGQLKKMASDGIMQNELDAAKERFLNNMIQASSNNSTLAATFSKLELMNLGFNYYQKAWQAVKQLEKSDLDELCKKYCNLNGMAKIKAGAQKD